MEFKNLSLSIDKKELLKEISFALPKGQFTALIGRNGSGKSSLLSCANLQHRYSGEILLNGTELKGLAPRERAKQLALLPQTLPAPDCTVWSLCAMGRNPYTDLLGRLSESDQAAITAALKQADLLQFAARKVSTLSGGERQRAFLAMILAQDAPILLLDEPTAYLDLRATTDFCRILKALVETQGKTVLAVLHDLNTAVAFADHLLILQEGRLIYSGSTAQCLQTDRIEQAFDVCRKQIDGRTFFY